MDGNDLLEGGARSDSLLGGNGDDTLYGGALVDGDTNAGYQDADDFDLADTILGQNGADSLLGGLGGDSMEGGAANDAIKATHELSSTENNSNNDGAVDNMWGEVNGVNSQSGDTVIGTKGPANPRDRKDGAQM